MWRIMRFVLSGKMYEISARSLHVDLIRLTIVVGALTFVLSAFLMLDRTGFFASRSPCIQVHKPALEIAQSLQPIQTARPTTSRSTTPRPSSPKCHPTDNILLLKVHKCASSAFQNILLRYGDVRNLTIVLPPTDNYLGHLEKFSAEFILPLPSTFGNQYNILTHHTRFDKQNMAKVMPKNTVYISSLKEPATMFESAFDFFSLARRYSTNLTAYIEKPHSFYYSKHYNRSRFGRNPMMFDFGLDVVDFENQTAITTRIKELERTFSLVMIVEEMDAALVLLKDLLCWSWNDVITFRVNKRKESRVVPLSLGAKQKILAWNYADNQLYQHFYGVFQKKKKQYGLGRLKTDIAILKQLMKLWNSRCSKTMTVGVEQDFVVATQSPALSVEFQKEAQYELDGKRIEQQCARLAMKELPYTNRLREKLWPRPSTESSR